MTVIRIDPKHPLTYEEFAALLQPEDWSVAKPRLERELAEYEKRYGMTSKEMARRWSLGDIPDTHEMFSWYGTYELYLRHKGEAQ